MGNEWEASPWVRQHRERISFALEVYPIDTPAEPARQMLEAGRLAETLGFDAFFVGDKPLWAPEPWLHLAALAVQTERVGLGLGIACALYRHPLMIARLAADLDNLSAGRLILGLGVGEEAGEFAALGQPFAPAPERQAALEEAVAIIRGVWGDEPFTFEGRHFRTSGARITPPPFQRPAPPLIIAGGGERVTLRQAAQFADACNLFQIDMSGTGALSLDDVRRKLEALRRHCAAIGRPYDTLLRTYLTGWTILAPGESQLRDKLDRYFPQGVEQRYSGQWRGFVLALTPERAVAHFRALAAAGIQYFIVMTLDAADQETVRLLAEQVVPRVVG